jgi:ATP-dependent DNA helicase RecG
MFTNCIKEGKPLPDYSSSDDYQVDLRFYGEIPDDAFYLFAQDIRHTPEHESQMNTFDWLTLHYIWKGNAEAVYKESCPKLLEMGLIAEDAYFGYVLSTHYLLYKPHVKSVAGQYDINHIQTVYHVIRRNGDASMSDFVAAFEGVLTQKQVRNLIEGLCKTPLIGSHGNARATRYSWVLS